jgi:hypothetical protein
MPSSEAAPLFVYGTLCCEPLVERLLGRRACRTPALAPGHRRFRVAGAPYPGMLPDPDCEVQGALLGGLSPEDLARLAHYEGNAFVLESVEVISRGVRLSAHTFMLSRARPELVSDEPWDLRSFERELLSAYLASEL